jgi:hypothetical protein
VNHSSKSSPCPVCGRDKDDKCRWNDHFLFCYRGDSFAPPDLRLGQRLAVNGWPTLAVVGLDGGFAGSSVVLAPDDGRAPACGCSSGARSAESLGRELAVRSAIKEMRVNLRQLLKCPCYDFLLYQELIAHRELAVLTWEKAVETYSLARGSSFLFSNRSQVFLLLKDSIKQLKFICKDINFFLSHYLNDPISK